MFTKVFVVNLDRRPDRMTEFTANWHESGMSSVLPEPVRVPAIDGRLCPRPDTWKVQGGGAWGCYRSHLRLIEQALNEGWSNILLLEDDARFNPDSAHHYQEFVKELPSDWDMLYLGGQHLKTNHSPQKVSQRVYIPFNVNRTHAWGISRKGMKEVYKHLNSPFRGQHHIDHHLGLLAEGRTIKIYCPDEWLAYQAAGKSNIAGKEFDDRAWIGAKALAHAIHQQFVAILGPHASGSSCIAGIAHAIGVHLGNNLQGYWNKEKGGFEAAGLASLCEKALPFPGVDFKQGKQERWRALRNWINQRRSEAFDRKTIAGGKYPQLCAFGPQLRNLLGENLKVISCDRSLEVSIASIQARCPNKPAKQLAKHQQLLWDSRESLIESLKPEQVLRISYDQAVETPLAIAQSMIDFFVDLHPVHNWQQQVQAFVLPELRHHMETANV